MKYLDPKDILVIHAKIIDETGGLHGIRDIGLLLSIAERTKGRFGGRELYKGIFKKAAIYAESLARHHIFSDGNKRTAVAASARFLFLNGFELNASNHEVEIFIVNVALNKLEIEGISDWLKEHSSKIKR